MVEASPSISVIHIEQYFDKSVSIREPILYFCVITLMIILYIRLVKHINF